MRGRPIRASLVLAGIATLLPAAMPAGAAAADLRASAHGAVDLGDAVPYVVTGRSCARSHVEARLRAGGRTVSGERSTGTPDQDGRCRGTAEVPGFRSLKRSGWKPGEPIGVRLRSARSGSVPLRFARTEVDAGEVAAGTPEIVAAEDRDTGARDRAVRMSPGDSIGLGRINLRDIDSVAVRLCVEGVETSGTGAPPSVGPLLIPPRVEPTTLISLRQDGPSGPAVVGPVDVAADPQELSRLSTLGFGGCYRLTVLPLTGRLQESAPELFLTAEVGLPGVLRVTSLDVAGTGAKQPAPLPPDEPGMRRIFDGRSLKGWDHENCVLRERSAVNARSGRGQSISGCSMTYRRPLENVVLRMRMRREDIYDNAGIYLDDQEIQLRSVGEYLPGGYFGTYAARWQKLNSFPDWSVIEVVQLGARHVVSVNGRTVTDVMRPDGAPEPYRLELVSQPIWSYRIGIETGFGNEGFPDATSFNDLGAFWFRDVRLLECDGPRDRRCLRIANARRGQVPARP